MPPTPPTTSTDQTDKVDLTIIIVNWNGCDDTLECLNSIFSSPTEALRVIVCDNASTDNSVPKIMTWARGEVPTPVADSQFYNPKTKTVQHPVSVHHIPVPISARPCPQERLTVIETGDNLGFAGGNNVGLRYALNAYPECQYFWLLNADTIITPEAPRHLLARMRAADKVGMCGTTVRFYHAPDTIQALNGSRFNRWTGTSIPIGKGETADRTCDPEVVEKQTDFVTGASLCVSRAFVESVGFMAEDYFLYFEEMDWAKRNAGQFVIGFAPDATVYHKEGGAIGSSSTPGKRSATSEYYLARSKFLFVRKHDGFLQFFTYLLYTVLQVGVRLFRTDRGNIRHILRGMTDGILGK